MIITATSDTAEHSALTVQSLGSGSGRPGGPGPGAVGPRPTATGHGAESLRAWGGAGRARGGSRGSDRGRGGPRAASGRRRTARARARAFAPLARARPNCGIATYDFAANYVSTSTESTGAGCVSTDSTFVRCFFVNSGPGTNLDGSGVENNVQVWVWIEIWMYQCRKQNSLRHFSEKSIPCGLSAQNPIAKMTVY